MGIPWADEEVQDLDLCYEAFAERHPGRSYKAWWNQRHAKQRVAPTPKIEFIDRVMPLSDDEIDEYLDSLLQASELGLDTNGEQTEVSIDIDTDRPIGIAFTGDWHIGQRGTDHRLLIEHNKLLAATPGLYVVGMGDYRHNAKVGGKPGTALYSALLPNPDDQKLLAERELRRFKGKLLGLVRGCHDDWDYQHAGLRSLGSICEELECASLWHGGVIRVAVGRQEYSVLARHKYGGNGVNSTNAQRRAYDEYPEDDRLDVICLAHLHYNDLQVRTRGSRHKVTYLRSGSYYVWDEYGQKLAGYHGEPGVPVVILWPDEKKVVAFEGTYLDEAIEILRYYRAE